MVGLGSRLGRPTGDCAVADAQHDSIVHALGGDFQRESLELAEPFEMSLPAVTKHLKVLERAGLITRSRDAQWRPCRLEARPLHEVSDWVGQYRQFWEQRLDRLEAYLKKLQTKEKRRVRKK